MATSSSSSQPRGTLSQVQCPQCLVPVVKRLSKNNNYYKCPQCRQWWFEGEQLASSGSGHNALGAGSGHNALGAVEVEQQPAASVVQEFQQARGELKMVALDVKALLGEIKLEIGSLRTEVKELEDLRTEVKELKDLKGLKTEVKEGEELKEMKEGKSPIGAAVVFMAIFFAVLVAFVWNK